MSKHTNVNPDHYKVAGRERQGEDVVHEVERREAKRLESEQRRANAKSGHPAGSNQKPSSSDESAAAAPKRNE
jgi:hypothetical protein